MSLRRVAVAFAAVAALLVIAHVTGVDGRAWRAAYPHLPPRVQAVPYRLRALVRPAMTPVALPTPAAPPTGVVPVQPTAAPTVTPRLPTWAIPSMATLPPVTHAYQTWNNCGPATISMALSVLGKDEGQAKAAVRLKPNPDDKNVSLDEMGRYAVERGALAALRADGRIETVQALVARGFPTVVETWFEPEPGDEMGHYRLVTGYDASARTLLMADSYMGPNVREDVDRFDADWRAFNRAYLVVYPPEREAEVVAIVGPGGAAMWLGAAARAADEVKVRPDAFGWFNLGTSLLAAGDSAGAADAYDRSRAIGLPWRMLWYQFGPFEAYGAVGRWTDVAALANANLANVDDLEESWYWLGRARSAAGDTAGAQAAWRRAFALNPLYAPARLALEAEGAP